MIIELQNTCKQGHSRGNCNKRFKLGHYSGDFNRGFKQGHYRGDFNKGFKQGHYRGDKNPLGGNVNNVTIEQWNKGKTMVESLRVANEIISN